MDKTICEHGFRRHKCDACDYRQERDEALAESERLRQTLVRAAEMLALYDDYGERAVRDARFAIRSSLGIN